MWLPVQLFLMLSVIITSDDNQLAVCVTNIRKKNLTCLLYRSPESTVKFLHKLILQLIDNYATNKTQEILPSDFHSPITCSINR